MWSSTIVTLFSALLIIPNIAFATPIGDAHLSERDDPAMVLTPHGPRPAANVHLIPDGGEIRIVGDEIHLLNSTGAIIHTAIYDGTPVRTRSFETAGERAPSKRSLWARKFQDHWIAYASWYNYGPSPISYFSTVWTVPPAPKSYNGQTVFLFNSIEPASYNSILQPVLQYGPSQAGGGAEYAVASWWVVGQTGYHTALQPVSVGQSLTGIIYLKACAAGTYTYETYFQGISGTLTLYGSKQLVWATETLEAYNIQSISNYPAGTTVFHNINLETDSGLTPPVTWSVSNDVADGLYAIVNRQGPTNAQVTIEY